MARIIEPTAEQLQGYHDWIASRPESVRKVAEQFDPWSLYRMKSSGHRCTVYGFDEEDDGNVTLTVNVTGEYNFTMFDRQVFGVDPDDLEQCDLPTQHEVTGTVLTGDDEVEEFIDAVRPAILAARNKID